MITLFRTVRYLSPFNCYVPLPLYSTLAYGRQKKEKNTCICQSGIGDSENFSVIESQNHLIAYVFNSRIFVNTSHETRSELDR